MWACGDDGGGPTSPTAPSTPVATPVNLNGATFVETGTYDGDDADRTTTLTGIVQEATALRGQLHYELDDRPTMEEEGEWSWSGTLSSTTCPCDIDFRGDGQVRVVWLGGIRVRASISYRYQGTLSADGTTITGTVNVQRTARSGEVSESVGPATFRRE